MSKFTPKINNILKNKGSKKTEKPASISSLPPSIPVKLSKKIKDIHRTINDTDKTKPHINMTTKDSSCKQKSRV